MPAPLDCPEMECWQALLDDGVPPAERERYERHLDSCRACQERLDRADRFDGELLRQAHRLGDPTATPIEPLLSGVLERLREGTAPERAGPPGPEELYFLQPSDHPGALGTLGGYAVLEVVGQGGMGLVLKALDPALNRLVAIKVLAAAIAGSATARRRFAREARAAAAICHDHVVPVHCVSEADGLPYLVMQYVAGESLQERIDREGPLPVEEVVQIGLQTASGLAAAHAQGLIHRDVKPANLLLEDGLARVKITDFGLARMADDAGLTRDGVVAGTPEYMAPEQARGEAVDHRADLYALGAILYACCTGRPPFRGATALAVLRRVTDEAPAAVRSLNPDVPAWLEQLIGRLMAKDPAGRLPGAAEAAALLEGYLAHLRQPATAPAPELPSSPRALASGRRRMPSRATTRKAILAIIGLVGILGLLGVWGAGLPGAGGSPRGRTGHNPAAQAGPPQATPLLAARPAGPEGWLTAAVAAFVLLLLLTLAAGWYLRRRRLGRTPAATGGGEGPAPPAAAASVSLTCAACGKKLRAREELAGKKVKCPGCGQPVLVPAAEAAPAPAPARSPWRLRAAAAAALVLFLLVAALLIRATHRDRRPADIFDRPLGMEPTPGIDEQGLFGLEVSSGSGVPFRWTDGAAKLVVPLGDQVPQAVAVHLHVTGSTPAPTHIGVKINGESVYDGQAAPQCDWLRTFDLTGKNLGPALTVETTSDTFVPADLNKTNQDFRTLGVHFLGVTLFRTVKGYINVPLGVRAVPGVGEEGFHEPEKDQPDNRWTNGSARLFVPIRDKRPRALVLGLKIPDRDGYRVKVVVNGQTLRDEAVEPNSEWSAELPLDGVDLGDEARIEIITPTFNPALVTSHRGDWRELGVRVTQLMLVP